MARRISRPRTPDRSHNMVATTSPSLKKSPTIRSSPRSPRSPRSPMSPDSFGSKSPRWQYGLHRRVFLDHLNQWSLSHDSSPHFHGTISICETFCFTDACQLGKSVHCILTHRWWTHARKRIVIRLFAPRNENGIYRLVVRNGAGWVTAREYFSQSHFSLHRLQTYKCDTFSQASLTNMLKSRSEIIEHELDDKDAVTIRPLFHPFLRLPLELQQLILGTALGKTDVYQPSRSPRQVGFSTYDNASGQLKAVRAAIHLHTAFQISKALSRHLIPWIYRTTTFHFSTTGLTNFLWQAGPTNRSYMNKIALKLGRSAILHCIRWLAPDPIFTLFNPPLATEPPGLRYLWRCRIQDLAKQLSLTMLTIDIDNVPTADIPFVVRTLSGCFGSCKNVRITSSGVTVTPNDERLSGLKHYQTWAVLCKTAFESYKWEPCYFDKRIRSLSVDVLSWEMKERREFFDRVSDTNVLESLVAL